MPLIEDTDLLAAVVAAKGDTDLAAEKLSCSSIDLAKRLQTIPFEALSETIKSVVAFQMLDTLKYVQLQVISSLDDYTPATASRLLIDVIDRLQSLAAPPPSSSNNSPIVIQQMMLQESQQVREELARRIINSQQPVPDRGLSIIEHDNSD